MVDGCVTSGIISQDEDISWRVMGDLSQVVEEEGHPWGVQVAIGQVCGLQKYKGGSNPRRGLDHRKEKII